MISCVVGSNNLVPRRLHLPIWFGKGPVAPFCCLLVGTRATRHMNGMRMLIPWVDTRVRTPRLRHLHYEYTVFFSPTNRNTQSDNISTFGGEIKGTF